MKILLRIPMIMLVLSMIACSEFTTVPTMPPTSRFYVSGHCTIQSRYRVIDADIYTDRVTGQQYLFAWEGNDQIFTWINPEVLHSNPEK